MMARIKFWDCSLRTEIVAPLGVGLIVAGVAIFHCASNHRIHGTGGTPGSRTLYRLALLNDALTLYRHYHGVFPAAPIESAVDSLVPPMYINSHTLRSRWVTADGLVDAWGTRLRYCTRSGVDGRTEACYIYSCGANRRDEGGLGYGDDVAQTDPPAWVNRGSSRSLGTLRPSCPN